MTPTPPKRGKLLIAMVVILAIAGCNAAVQAIFVGAGIWQDSSPLPYIQAVIAIIAIAAAVGAWKLRDWSAWLAFAYGVVTGAMIVSLPRFTDIPAEAVAGLKFSAVILLVIGAGLAWGIRVGIRRARTT